jgi:hypothetical protein
MAALFYGFASEIDPEGRSRTPWRKLNLSSASTPDSLPLRTWEEVRYVLELRHGMHATHRSSRAFFSAMRRSDFRAAGCRWDQTRRVQQFELLLDKEAIVLFRRPVPRALRTFVPERFRTDTQEERMRMNREEVLRAERKRAKLAALEVAMERMTENERIHAIIANAAELADEMPLALLTAKDARRRKDATTHADDYEFVGSRPVPPATYTCTGCGEPGEHFRADCPRELRVSQAVVELQKNQHATVHIDAAVDKIQLSHGIPKMFLQRVKLGGGDAKGGTGAPLPLASDLAAGVATKLSAAAAAAAASSGAASASASASDTVRAALTTRDGDVVVDVRSSSHVMAKMVIQVDPSEVLARLAARKRDRRVHDDDDEWRFDFEPYVEAHDEVYAEKLNNLYTEMPQLRRKLQSMCTHWLRGICIKGVLCEYMHVYSMEGIPICKFYLQGKCLNDECAFQHVLPPSAPGGGHQNTTRRVPVCMDYAVGFCPLGPRCPQQHIRRDSPYIADFAGNDALFAAMVKVHDVFMKETHKDEIHAKKTYTLTRAATKRLFTSVEQAMAGAEVSASVAKRSWTRSRHHALPFVLSQSQ